MSRKLPEGEGKRVPLNMRTTATTRSRIEAAAEASGRSLAQEVEIRLERSFELPDIINASVKQTAELFSEQYKNILDQSQALMLEMAGGDSYFMLWGMMAFAIQKAEAETGKTIREDEFTRNKAEKEVLGVIPHIFRNLPGTYSEFIARSAKNARLREQGGLPSGLAALGAGLAPLGHKGPWPPTE